MDECEGVCLGNVLIVNVKPAAVENRPPIYKSQFPKMQKSKCFFGSVTDGSADRRDADKFLSVFLGGTLTISQMGKIKGGTSFFEKSGKIYTTNIHRFHFWCSITPRGGVRPLAGGRYKSRWAKGARVTPGGGGVPCPLPAHAPTGRELPSKEAQEVLNKKPRRVDRSGEV